MYAGIDLGGTNIACAIGDAEGHIVAERSVPTHSHEGPSAVLDRIARLIREMAPRVEAVGMGLPGRVDREAGISQFLPNMPTQWRDVPVAQILRAQLQAPVYLLNDARLATLGELTFGGREDWLRKFGTMVFFTLGTGVGGGIVVEGQLRLGPWGAAGEVGHQTIISDGLLCGCGNRGCLETVASAPALSGEGVRLMRSGLAPQLHQLVEGEASRITPQQMAAAALAGDAAVMEAIERVAGYLGIAIANIVSLLHPELVVLGGGMAQMGEVLLQPVRQQVVRRVGMFPADGVRIEQSALGDRAGVMGGLALAARSGQV
ncbi:MAG: ROK family protein [Acidobacteria bacterium]|nr:ROK family protein [Acidobacteriota bacterium]